MSSCVQTNRQNGVTWVMSRKNSRVSWGKKVGYERKGEWTLLYDVEKVSGSMKIGICMTRVGSSKRSLPQLISCHIGSAPWTGSSAVWAVITEDSSQCCRVLGHVVTR